MIGKRYRLDGVTGTVETVTPLVLRTDDGTLFHVKVTCAMIDTIMNAMTDEYIHIYDYSYSETEVGLDGSYTKTQILLLADLLRQV